MAEIPVLTCPVCDRSAGFDAERTATEALKEEAWEHLAEHRGLDEPKRAIYAVMMVEQREPRRLPDGESLEGSAGEWIEGSPAKPLA